MTLMSYTAELSKIRFLHLVNPDKTGERDDQIVSAFTT